jgi:hypothetical protein
MVEQYLQHGRRKRQQCGPLSGDGREHRGRIELPEDLANLKILLVSDGCDYKFENPASRRWATRRAKRKGPRQPSATAVKKT